MNWTRPLLASAVAGTAAVAAVAVSPSAAAEPDFVPGTGPCTAVPAGLNLIVPHSGGVAMTSSVGYEMLDAPIAAGPRMAVRGPDGTVWVEAVVDGLLGVHRIPPGGPATGIVDGDVVLSSVGWLDGRSAAVILDRNSDHQRPADPDSYGAIVVDYADGEQIDVGAAGGPEYLALSVTLGAGRLAEGASVDLAEGFAYYDASGAAHTDWFAPTATAPYNSPPFYQWPIAADAGGDSGGVNLSWIEGPDWDGATNEIAGGWSLVVADAVTGTESLRLDLGAPGEILMRADFDGRFWVGTFSDTTDPESVPEAARVIVVDTQAPTPAVVDAVCPPGVTATIDRLGTPAPPPVAPPPSTTSPPSTPTPQPAGGCDGYVFAEAEYPVRRCHEGPMVSIVQGQLVARGYDIQSDGYFGLATEDAVQDFQAANGLEADGLVGPDTFAALYTGDPPASDNNGNGMIDPWEIPLEPGGGEESSGDRFAGLIYYVGENDEILEASSGQRVGARLLQSIEVENESNAVPLAAVHVAFGDTEYLWFVRILVADAPASWEVLQFVDIGPAEVWECITGDCTSADGDGVGLITSALYSPQGVTVNQAWYFNSAPLEILEVDPEGIVCPT